MFPGIPPLQWVVNCRDDEFTFEIFELSFDITARPSCSCVIRRGGWSLCITSKQRCNGFGLEWFRREELSLLLPACAIVGEVSSLSGVAGARASIVQ